jgi:nucleosome binding factor SPN SPT16 subunit
LSLHRGNVDEDQTYLKSVVFHQWLFGYELPDTILLLTEDGNVYVCATKKKCEFLQPAVDQKNEDFNIHLLLRNKEDNNAANYETLLEHASKSSGNSQVPKVGVISKERDSNKSTRGPVLAPFETKLDEAVDGKKIELVDANHGLALVMAVKDDTEKDLMKKSSVLSNKVMKHGFVKKLEEIIEEETEITHEAFASEIEAILEDPNKINLSVPASDVSPCYFPIVQSGGNYDLKISAQSTSDRLSPDIITVSFGARYKLYCSNIARTFFIDPPKVVSTTYETLLEMQDACLDAMQPGNPLKAVYKAAVKFLSENGREDLIAKLPKNLGFAQGLDFRDTSLTLSAKNTVTFRKGMVFCLAVGFQNLELSEEDLEDTSKHSPVRVC